MPARKSGNRGVNTMAISELVDGLRVFREGICVSREWPAGEAMAELLGVLRRRYTNGSRIVSRARIEATVSHYLCSGQVVRAQSIFDLCLGAGWLDEAGRGILADRQLRRRLFDLAATATGRARRLKAFRGLLYAYWSFPLHQPTTSREAIDGWQELRDWLKRRHDEISRHPARKPGWFSMLAPHRHLLEADPCSRYAKSLIEGNLDELQQAFDCLFIPADSWLRTEAVMAPIVAATQWPDAAFHDALPALIKLATGRAGIQVGSGVVRHALAALLMRHARLEQHQAHEQLFLLAIEKIGNPWRQQSAWDACVRDAGGDPCALAHAMVNSWLRDRMIGEFLAGSAPDDMRRQLWLRFSVFMQAIVVASRGQDGEDRALLARMGEFLLWVPHDSAQSVAVYPWQAVFFNGGARLLEQDSVDGATVQKILDRCAPVARLSQTGDSRCETELRNFLFAKDMDRFGAVPPAPTLARS